MISTWKAKAIEVSNVNKRAKGLKRKAQELKKRDRELKKLEELKRKYTPSEGMLR